MNRQLTPRTSPVVWQDWTEGPLSKQDLIQYCEKGFFVCRQALPLKEVQELHLTAMKAAETKKKSSIFESDKRTLRSLFNFHQIHSNHLIPFIRNHLKPYAQQILGSDLYVHQSHINYKWAGCGGEFFWHSDYTYWKYQDGMTQPRAISLVIFLDPHRAHNGPLLCLPGSHQWYYPSQLAKNQRPHQDQIRHDYQLDLETSGLVAPLYIQQLNKIKPVQMIKGEPGDFLIMDANLWHASHQNQSLDNRAALFVILNHLDNKIGAPLSGGDPRPDFISDRSFLPL